MNGLRRHDSFYVASVLVYAFSFHTDYELKGDVNRVVFPTGTSLFDDTLYIYYGAPDNNDSGSFCQLQALLTELKPVGKD